MTLLMLHPASLQCNLCCTRTLRCGSQASTRCKNSRVHFSCRKVDSHRKELTCVWTLYAMLQIDKQPQISICRRGPVPPAAQPSRSISFHTVLRSESTRKEFQKRRFTWTPGLMSGFLQAPARHPKHCSMPQFEENKTTTGCKRVAGNGSS